MAVAPGISLTWFFVKIKQEFVKAFRGVLIYLCTHAAKINCVCTKLTTLAGENVPHRGESLLTQHRQRHKTAGVLEKAVGEGSTRI
jgi:hypothetical protein